MDFTLDFKITVRLNDTTLAVLNGGWFNLIDALLQSVRGDAPDNSYDWFFFPGQSILDEGSNSMMLIRLRDTIIEPPEKSYAPIHQYSEGTSLFGKDLIVFFEKEAGSYADITLIGNKEGLLWFATQLIDMILSGESSKVFKSKSSHMVPECEITVSERTRGGLTPDPSPLR